MECRGDAVLVDPNFQLPENVGCVLHLVQDQRRVPTAKQVMRVESRQFRFGRNIQSHITRLWQELACERGFADLACSRENDHRELCPGSSKAAL